MKEAKKLLFKNKSAVLSVLIGAHLLGIPFVNDSNLIDPKLISRYLYVSLGLVVFTLVFFIFLINANKKFDVNPIWQLPVCLLSVSYITTVFYAHNTTEAVFWANKITLFATAFLLFLYFRIYDLVNFKIIGVFVALMVLASIALFFIEAEKKELLKTTTLVDKNLYALSSPFGHKNLFSSYLLLCLPFLFVLFKTKKKKILFFVSALLAGMLIALLLLQTKAVLLGIIVGGFYGIFPILKFFYKTHQKRVILNLFALFLLISSVFIVVFIYFDHFSLLFQTDSFKERLLVWSSCISLIKDHFWLGVGGGNWQIFFPSYGLNEFYLVNLDIHLGYQTFQRPHNDFLWVFGETGVIGFLSYCGVFVFAFIGLLKQLQQSIVKSKQLLLISFLIILVAYVVVSLFDFPLERSEHQLIAALFLSMCVPIKEKTHNKPNSKKNWTYLILIVVLTATILCSIFGYLRYEEEKKHLNVLRAHKQGNWTKMIEHSQTIDQRFFNLDHFSIPVSWYAGVGYYSQGSLTKALENFKHAHMIAPFQVHVINNLAGVYQKTNSPEKAMMYYDKALKIAEHHYEVLLNKSIAHYKENEFNEAFYTLLKLTYKDEHPPLYHRAMRQVFNTKLDLLKNTSTYYPKSIENLQQSDSLKRVFLYEYQINNQSLDTLFNTFVMDL